MSPRPTVKLWLDDERDPPDESWVWVDNAKSAIAMLNTLDVTEISLDHDLGDENIFGNGYHVLCEIERLVFTDDEYKVPDITIHTANPSAKEKMGAGLARIWKRAKTGE